jgi:hypothetical protein
LEILGKADDPRWQWGIVYQWLADGLDPEKHIFPTLKAMAADGRAAKATTLKYFEKAIVEARSRNGVGNARPAGDDPDRDARLQHEMRVGGYLKYGLWDESWGPKPADDAA